MNTLRIVSMSLALGIFWLGCGPDDDWCTPDGYQGPYHCPSDTDTCTQGDNMSNPRMSGTVDADATVPTFTIAWDEGTGAGRYLPAEYFAAAQLAGEPAVHVVSTVAHTAEREITVELMNLTAYLQSNSHLAFALSFPDRAGFIDCTHPGSTDFYMLDIDVAFDGTNNVTGVEFNQWIIFGDI